MYRREKGHCKGNALQYRNDVVAQGTCERGYGKGKIKQTQNNTVTTRVQARLMVKEGP